MPKKMEPVAVGDVFGKLTVSGEASKDIDGRMRYPCRCVCGKSKTAKPSDLRRGVISSCGCGKAEGSLMLSAGQDNWIALERARGATCVVVDDLYEFREWYREQIGSK